MARKTKKEAQETREDILEAATVVFMKDGVSKASLEAIAKEAGVTRGAVYWHFTNKIDIFTALHEQLHLPLMDRILADIERNHPCPLRQLEELCVKLLLEVETDAKKRRILTIFYQKCDYSGELAPLLEIQNANKRKSFGLFIQYFERAATLGHLPAGAVPATLTIALHCYLGGICQEYLRNPTLIPMQTNAAPLMRLFFQGIAACDK